MTANWAAGRLWRLLRKLRELPCYLLRELLYRLLYRLLNGLLYRLLGGLLPLVNILLIICCACWNSNDLADMKIIRINAGVCIDDVLHAHPILICDLIKCIALLNDICYHEIITSESGYEFIAVRVIHTVQAGRHIKAEKTPDD